MHWVDLFTLATLDRDKRPAVATLRAVRTGDHVRRAATPPRLVRLGELLTNLAGHPVRVVVDESSFSHPSTANDAPPAHPGQAANPRAARQDAYKLPVVREVLDVFPDAVVTRFEDDASPPEMGETTDSTEGTD